MSMLLEWDSMGMTLKIREEIASLKVFNKIIRNDSTPDKSKATAIFSYLYFMHNPLSDYVDMYENEGDRKQKVLEDTGITEAMVSTRMVLAAEEYYKDKTKNKALGIVRDNMKSIEDLRQFMVDFNLEDIETKDRMSAAKGKADLIKTLNLLAVDTEGALRKLKKDFDQQNPLVEDKRSVGDRIELENDDIDDNYS